MFAIQYGERLRNIEQLLMQDMARVLGVCLDFMLVTKLHSSPVVVRSCHSPEVMFAIVLDPLFKGRIGDL